MLEVLVEKIQLHNVRDFILSSWEVLGTQTVNCVSSCHKVRPLLGAFPLSKGKWLGLANLMWMGSWRSEVTTLSLSSTLSERREV